MLTTLGLAGVCGYNVVWGVAPALHSPLMSVTNAISGLTAVGGMYVMGGGLMPQTLPQYLGAAAFLASNINIFGGFLVTKRMLDMFKREGYAPEFNHLYALPAAAAVAGIVGAHAYGVKNFQQLAYLASSISCISSIGCLGNQETARHST
eukprot:GABW01000245.1.p1 GENE.GABW01000245.1~~GABW01000245.1.p1  ORF type:complete len:150 (-),score=31.81 GABW01000245.1:3-452(-)